MQARRFQKSRYDRSSPAIAFRVPPRHLQVKRMIPKSGRRFPAFAKPASTGEARSEKIMRRDKGRGHWRF